MDKGELDVAGAETPREVALAGRPADRAETLPPGERLDEQSDEQLDEPPGQRLDEPRSRGEVYAELRQRVESGWEPRSFDAPRAELARFDAERAALPATSLDDAASYVEQHRAERPWLSVCDSASPEARRIIAAADAGGGHGHIRHEGWVTEEASMRRAAYLEDPAQLDDGKRSLGIDGLKANDRPHQCRTTSTRITDPDAFATAFARGVEHPKVREALDMPVDPDIRPNEVTIPIADLLGRDGHRYCTGWRLDQGDGSMRTAHANREAWLAARAAGREPDQPEPRTRPVPTFEGGVITFMFERNHAGNRYEIATMFPRPAPQSGIR